MSQQQDLMRLRMALDKWGADLKMSLPSTRGRQKPREKNPDTALARLITSLRDDYGLTLDTISQSLSDKLGRKIALSTLYAWTAGSTPRSIPLAAIEQALSEIMKAHERIEGGAWVEAEQVQAQIQAWEKALSRRQIAIAADEFPSVIEAWALGRHRVKRPKWN